MTLAPFFVPEECLLTLDGDIDVASAGDLITAGTRAAAQAAGTLRIDMAGVTFLDSCGIGALIAIRNAALAAGRDLALERVPPRAARVIALTGLTQVFRIL